MNKTENTPFALVHRAFVHFADFTAFSALTWGLRPRLYAVVRFADCR